MTDRLFYCEKHSAVHPEQPRMRNKHQILYIKRPEICIMQTLRP